jgi:hypothetical protein
MHLYCRRHEWRGPFRGALRHLLAMAHLMERCQWRRDYE